MEENSISETFVVLVSNLTKISLLKGRLLRKRTFKICNNELLDSRQPKLEL
jgi:hypothetical protein